jgi:hypothetical protein
MPNVKRRAGMAKALHDAPLSELQIAVMHQTASATQSS